MNKLMTAVTVSSLTLMMGCQDNTYTYYADTDLDLYGDPENTTTVPDTEPPTGYVTDNTDCDDNDSNNYPGNTEVPDGFDNDCDGIADNGIPSTDVRYVFVTSNTYDGDLGGLAGADQKCQDAANSGGVTEFQGKTFKAWLSSSTESANSRLEHANVKYTGFINDGLNLQFPSIVFSALNWVDLTDGSIGTADLNPSTLDCEGCALGDETGSSQHAGYFYGVWSGVHWDGSSWDGSLSFPFNHPFEYDLNNNVISYLSITNPNCDNWTSNFDCFYNPGCNDGNEMSFGATTQVTTLNSSGLGLDPNAALDPNTVLTTADYGNICSMLLPLLCIQQGE